MKILPHHSFELWTQMKPEDALDALAAHVEPRMLFRITRPGAANDRRFQGEVLGRRFTILRILGYRNSFMPVVKGVASEAGGGARIRVRMRLFSFVAAFLALWCALCACLFWLGATGVSTDWCYVSLALLGVGYAVSMGGFWFEAAKQERVLREIFQAAP